MKPLKQKSYGSIPHLLGSRIGPAEHHVHEGQHKIATEKTRDKLDKIIVQEKLDGGNVGIAKLNGKILALTRSGYLASTSKFATHHAFDVWVKDNYSRFDDILKEGERLCGEWLLTAVGTLYNLPHEPFVAFDIMRGNDRLNFYQFTERIEDTFVTPRTLHIGNSFPIEMALRVLDIRSQAMHGAIGKIEGAIWRVERKNKVDFLCKYVRPDKVDGTYLKEIVFNGVPYKYDYLKEIVIGFAKLVQPTGITESQ